MTFAITPAVEALYRNFDTATLKQFRMAFEIDRLKGADRSFCDGRLALIDRILAERHEPTDDRR